MGMQKHVKASQEDAKHKANNNKAQKANLLENGHKEINQSTNCQQTCKTQTINTNKKHSADMIQTLAG